MSELSSKHTNCKLSKNVFNQLIILSTSLTTIYYVLLLSTTNYYYLINGLDLRVSKRLCSANIQNIVKMRQNPWTQIRGGSFFYFVKTFYVQLSKWLLGVKFKVAIVQQSPALGHHYFNCHLDLNVQQVITRVVSTGMSESLTTTTLRHYYSDTEGNTSALQHCDCDGSQ